MANLKKVSIEDLRQILVEVDGGAAIQRLMAVITYKEIGGLTQKAAAKLSDQEFGRFIEVLHEPPKEIGTDACAWMVPHCPNLPERTIRCGVLRSPHPTVDDQSWAVTPDSSIAVCEFRRTRSEGVSGRLKKHSIWTMSTQS